MCKGGIQMCPGTPKILWDALVSFEVPSRCAKAAQIRQGPPKMIHLPPFFCAFSTPCARAPPVVPRTPWSHSPGFGKVGAQWVPQRDPFPLPHPPGGYFGAFWGFLGCSTSPLSCSSGTPLTSRGSERHPAAIRSGMRNPPRPFPGDNRGGGDTQSPLQRGPGHPRPAPRGAGGFVGFWFMAPAGRGRFAFTAGALLGLGFFMGSELAKRVGD